MSAPALFTQHRQLAAAIARDWHLPGADDDDVRQEALIGLWVATRDYDPAVGAPFVAFARTVIERRLSSLLKKAMRGKQLVLTDAVRDYDAPTIDACTAAIQRERVRLIVAAAHRLSRAERVTLRRIVNGAPYSTKADDNARYTVRRKLKAAA